MRQWLLCAGFAIVVAVSGCGGQSVYPVKGKVTYEGKPMKGGGSISFMPTAKQSGKTAGGEIKEDGTFEMMTNKPGDGSMPGQFRVVIHQTTDREPESSKDGEKAGKSISVVSKADRIPTIYSDPTNSPLIVTIEAKANDLTLELHRDAGGPAIEGAMRGRTSRDAFAWLKREPFVLRGE